MIRQAGLLVLGALCAGLASAAVPHMSLQAARWTVSDEHLAALTTEPGQCLAIPADPTQARSVAIGAAAFRAPLVLGGQAARSGISCHSCHRNGHDNPAFSYPGLSGAPGSADVTSSLFSSHRGDGTFNPRPIPNLSGPKHALMIDQSPAAARLEPFIHGLITQEFDGPEPSKAVLAGLAAYVRALSPAACGPAVRIELSHALTRIDKALDLAESSALAGDGATARLLISAARSEMGLIDERYPATSSATLLRRAAAALGRIERSMASNPARSGSELARWRSGTHAWQRPLQMAESRSLYNPSVLARWLSTASP
jgi:hypothetical protein